LLGAERWNLAVVLRTTTKKGRQLFEEKSAPSEKILATSMLDLLVFKGQRHKTSQKWNL